MNMVTWKQFAILAALVASVTPAPGANLVFREKSSHQGTMIRLGDIADIATASSAELKDLSTTILLPAPAPGTLQYLHRDQIRDLLVSRGFDLHGIEMTGATVVELGAANPQVEPENQIVQPVLTEQEAADLLQAAIQQYLAERTGHDRWKVKTSLDTTAYLRVASLGAELQIYGGRRPWTGRQQFQIAGRDSQERTVVVANVIKIQPVVILLRDLASGELVRATDVEIGLHEGSLSSTTITQLSQAIGMQARRSIQAGKILLESHLSAPLQVERGETVTVFARTAGITVRTYAVALEDGARGELIQVETLDGKERFAARVSGRRQLEVLASGTTVSDYASLPRHDTYRR